MDDNHCQRFFLKPTDTLHRRYEALRSYFVEHRPTSEIAARFGFTYGTTCSLIRDFRARCRNGGLPPFLDPSIRTTLRTARPGDRRPTRDARGR